MLTDFIVVADAGLLLRKNIALLKQAGYKFILGGRIKKESKSVQDWALSLEKDPHKLTETVINGDERIIRPTCRQRPPQPGQRHTAAAQGIFIGQNQQTECKPARLQQVPRHRKRCHGQHRRGQDRC